LFLFAWLIPSWLVFEIISTKLPHYTLPLYPALALLSARAVCFASTDAGAAEALGVHRRAAKIGLALWAFIGLLLAASAPTILARLGGFVAPTPLKAVMGAAVGIGAALIVLSASALTKRRYLLAQSLAIIAAVVASATTFGLVLPRLNALWVSSRVVNAIHSIDAAGTRPLAAVGYHEDSLTFLTHARVTRLRLEGLPAWLASNGNGLIIVPALRVEDAERLVQRPLTTLRRSTGFNYSKGEWVDLVIVEGGPGAASPPR
jgi:4-amino-4-deoxy-L-arabinose transferase-like glycosyltransferase